MPLYHVETWHRGTASPWWHRVPLRIGGAAPLLQPHLHAWAAEGRPLRLLEQAAAQDDPDAKALARYGLLLRRAQQAAQDAVVWLRFVNGRPISAITTKFLDWCCQLLT
jgi:hypothetical protein